MGRAAAITKSLKGLPGRLMNVEQVRVVVSVLKDRGSTSMWVIRHGEVGNSAGAVARRDGRMTVWKARRVAIAEARRRAGEYRGYASRKINKVSAAVNRRTGDVYYGVNRERPQIPHVLAERVPARSETDWPVNNCAELAAAARAVEDGANMDDLVIRTVQRKNGWLYLPCRNCVKWARP